MSAQRFLGAAWASVHGPAEPDALLKFCLDRRFQGLSVGPAPRARDWAALAPALKRLPAEVVAVRVCGIHEVERRADAGLASTNAGDRDVALRIIGDAAALATRLECDRVLLEPGIVRVVGDAGPTDLGDAARPLSVDVAASQIARRNAAMNAGLDAACRSLFVLTRRHPDTTFCLMPSRSVFGLGEPAALEFLFEDLKRTKLRYWHDAAIAARRHEVLGTDQGLWLERFGSRMEGVTASDTADGVLHLPPGSGRVDYPLLASYTAPLARHFPVLVDLDPAVAQNEISGVHAFLDKMGL